VVDQAWSLIPSTKKGSERKTRIEEKRREGVEGERKEGGGKKEKKKKKWREERKERNGRKEGREKGREGGRKQLGNRCLEGGSSRLRDKEFNGAITLAAAQQVGCRNRQEQHKFQKTTYMEKPSCHATKGTH
jgi:hypothetical protein